MKLITCVEVRCCKSSKKTKDLWSEAQLQKQEKLALISVEPRPLIYLWSHCDRNGVCEDIDSLEHVRSDVCAEADIFGGHCTRNGQLSAQGCLLESAAKTGGGQTVHL